MTDKTIAIYNALYMYNTGARTIKEQLESTELLRELREKYGDKEIEKVKLTYSKGVY